MSGSIIDNGMVNTTKFERELIKMREAQQSDSSADHLAENGSGGNKEKDPGAHYRHSHKGIQLDPFRIARVYEMDCPALFTILKKCLMAGRRGYKDKRQDLNDIISAAQRELEIMTEDGE